jgi:crotonobetainyl-CoA:carnitine CoA-transferase CaiB-like acyl-CoA transferase
VFFGIQNEREWITFCGQVLEMPQISSDERFSSNNQRVAHREELHSLVSGVFERLTTSGVIQRLDDAGIANARLRDMHEFSAHPQLEARQRWAQIDSPVGPLRRALPPASLANAGVRLGPVPGLGEHTEKVLQEFLPPEPESR